MSRDSRPAEQQVTEEKKWTNKKKNKNEQVHQTDGQETERRGEMCFYSNIFIDPTPAATVVYFGRSPDMVKWWGRGARPVCVHVCVAGRLRNISKSNWSLGDANIGSNAFLF